MKERPILFSAPMVRAILEGRKTVTRRVAKPVKHPDLGNVYTPGALVLEDEPQHVIDRACPYGQPGDRLWVRETFAECYDYCDHPEMPGAPTEHFHLGWYYRADGDPKREYLDGFLSSWKPSIHMPREASRILLEITAVRVERLHDISEEQSSAEGVTKSTDPILPWTHAFAELWEQINGKGAWHANPWVWVVEFKRVMP